MGSVRNNAIPAPMPKPPRDIAHAMRKLSETRREAEKTILPWTLKSAKIRRAWRKLLRAEAAMDDDNTSNKRRRQKFEAVRPDLEIIKREIEHAKDVDNEVGYNRGYQLESDSSQTNDSDDSDDSGHDSDDSDYLRSQRMILDELLSLLIRRPIEDLW